MKKLTLKRARAGAGYTQEEIASKLGVTVRTIRMIESGALMKEETLDRLCSFYEVKKGQLDLEVEVTKKYRAGGK